MTPYYDDGRVVIYHGDCREILGDLDLSGFGLVIMDPPYGISHSTSYGASWENTRIANDESTALRDWLIALLQPRPMVVFGTWKAPRPSDTRAVLVWDKGPAFGMGDLSFPWKGSWEEIYVLGQGWTGRRDEGVLRGHTVVSWERRGRTHPHEKPVSLLSHFIQKMPGSDVVDPCMGTGPTLRAAKDLGRRAIGIEIEERYCEIAARRLSQEVLDLGGAA